MIEVFADAMLALVFICVLGIILTWASENGYI